MSQANNSFYSSLDLIWNVNWCLKQFSKTKQYSTDDLRELIKHLEAIIDGMEYDNDSLANMLRDVEEPPLDVYECFYKT